MKKLKQAGTLLAVMGALMLWEGCASFESNTGKSVAGITTTVEAGRKAWVDYVGAQRALVPDPAKRQDLEQKVAKVGEAYAKYQSAMAAANAALTAYHLAPTNQSQVTTALQMLAAASADLMALITSFTSTK